MNCLLKYDILKHPNVKYTKDGSGIAYYHNEIRHTIDDWQNIVLTDNEYELLSEEDLEEYFKEQEKQ